MILASSNGSVAFSSEIADAVKTAVDMTYSSIFGESPVLLPDDQQADSGPCVAGILSFIGNKPFSLSWILTEDAAPVLAQKFTGLEIPFDSPDMGDVAGELVNVLAGEVIAQLEKRGVKSQMSLPTVARGNPLELMSEKGLSVTRLDFTSTQGRFWLRLASAKPSSFLGRMPGT